MNYKVGEKIRELRKRKHWSQTELGKKIGLKQSSIGNIETGQNKLTKMCTVNKILELFDISFDYLFEDDINVFKNKEKCEFDKRIEFELFQMNIQNLKLVNNIINDFIEYENNVKTGDSNVEL